MDLTAQLTKREFEIAERLALGASKKDIPDLMQIKTGRQPISFLTVEVITKSIYEKLSIQKVNELCVWYFSTQYKISVDFSPLKRQIVATILLGIIVLAEVTAKSDFVRPASARSVRTMARARRGNKKDSNTFEITEL